ncbi:MAG: diguanylate cyclase [Gammaproteobacteria bacterium]|nr:diguanylate cyclase [Gammaproteobacteria bacterium]
MIPQVARQGRERAVRRQLAQALRKSEEAFRAIIETSKDWIWATNLDGILTYSNPAIQSILGYTEDEIIGKPYLDFVHTDDKGMMEQRFREPQKLQHGWSNFVIRRLHKNDDYRFLESNAVPILNNAKEFAGFRGVDRDITERKQMEKELKHLASHDPLTGLYNRGELKLRLHDEIQRASRYSNPLSAFLVDADHFKLINDTYGHRTGDSVLKNFAKILELAIRNTDYVARYGGEEFVVILPETPLPKAAELAERLRAQIEESLFLTEEGKELKLTASIGVAAFSEHIQNGQDLLNAADTAMYAAKKAGRNLVKTTDYLVTGISTPQ